MTQPTPRQSVVRRPSGDPDAARRLAQAYEELADALEAQSRVISSVLRQVGHRWWGAGSAASERPEQVMTQDSTHVATALRRIAADLRVYAHKLAMAHEHHGWSIGRLVAMGALVTVGAAAVVVMVGAAAPAEAAAATLAVEGAEVAAAGAGVAGEATAGALSAASGVFATVRALLPFVVPHLVSAGASVGFDAVSELVTGQGVDIHSLEVAAAVGFTGSGAGGVVESRLAAAGPMWRRLGEAAIWVGAGSAGDVADHGEVDPVDAAAYGITGAVARDVRAAADAVGLRVVRTWRGYSRVRF
jgi:uncharacterized protein YukE